MTERDLVFEEARTAIVRLRAGAPAGTPMCLGNLLNAVLTRAEAAEKDAAALRVVMERIAKESLYYEDIARAALEAKP